MRVTIRSLDGRELAEVDLDDLLALHDWSRDVMVRAEVGDWTAISAVEKAGRDARDPRVPTTERRWNVLALILLSRAMGERLTGRPIIET